MSTDSTATEYTIPGIVDFLLQEWRRSERDRAAWDKERAQLQADVARLHGERQGFERVQNDLVRRIKMLEHVIRQERAKHGTGAPETPKALQVDTTAPQLSAIMNRSQARVRASPRGQGILAKYLEQVGASDALLGSRSRTLPARPVVSATLPARVGVASAAATTVPDSAPPAKAPSAAAAALADSTMPARAAPVQPPPDSVVPKAASGKMWTHRQAMRSHMDGVRTVCFTQTSGSVVSASDDGTLKLWALRDTEPVFTYRGHVGAVLCAAVSEQRSIIVSGGIDTAVNIWNLLDSAHTSVSDPVSSAVSQLQKSFVGHTDAVWDVSLQNTSSLVLSASADGTVRLWKSDQSSPLVHKVTLDGGRIPTSAQFVATNTSQAVFADSSARVTLLDVNTGQKVWESQTGADGAAPSVSSQVNKIVTHNVMQLAITAHEDHTVKFIDLNSGKVTHSQTAHPDAVSSLAVDPNDLYLATGGHEGSLRFWDVRKHSMLQELQAHQRKFDEGLLCVAYHPTKSFVATSGADSLIKLYQ